MVIKSGSFDKTKFIRPGWIFEPVISRVWGEHLPLCYPAVKHSVFSFYKSGNVSSFLGAKAYYSLSGLNRTPKG